MLNPFSLTVYDRVLKRQGPVGAPRECTFDVRFNDQGVGSFAVSAADPVRQFLEAPGARLWVTYRGEHLISGPVRNLDGSFAPAGLVTYSIEDDWRELPNTLGWPVPAGQLTPVSLTDQAQGTATGKGYYQFPAALSSAESLIKDLLTVNFRRLGRRVDVRPDLGRGGDARAAGMVPQVRFDPLDEAIDELLAWSGLGLKVWHEGGTRLVADVYQPTTRQPALTVESGIVKSGLWSLQGPTATRTVVGGPGEDVARAFYGVNDATGLESSWGDIIEVFRDATGANLEWPDTVPEAERLAKFFLLRSEVSSTDKAVFKSYLTAAGRKGLTEGRPTSGLSVELAETRSFHFGGPDGVHLGDVMSVSAQGQKFVERIRACTLSLKGKQFTVVPQVGERTDDPDEQLALSLRRLMAASRLQSTRR